MIKVNLLPVKKKKKPKPIPAFIISAIIFTVAVVLVMAYLIYFFNGRIKERQAKVSKNNIEIQILNEKLKEVADYEKRIIIVQQHKEIIEQLGRNKTLPVKMVDEISARLPVGVWLDSMKLEGNNLVLGCTAFTNTDVVNYVNNLKNSRLFTEVFLRESVQSYIEKKSIYTFKLSLTVRS